MSSVTGFFTPVLTTLNYSLADFTDILLHLLGRTEWNSSDKNWISSDKNCMNPVMHQMVHSHRFVIVIVLSF